MALSEKEVKNIKESLIQQVDSMNISEQEKAKAKAEIETLPPEQLEKFIKPAATCIFCDISASKAESYKIMENDAATIVLEINPLSKGHSLLIPKDHIGLTDFTKKHFDLLQKAIKELNKKLNPVQISISSNESGGHCVVNILPVTGEETGKRQKATKEQLEELSNKLALEHIEEKTEAIKKKVDKEKEEKVSEPEIIIEKAPVRIP